MKEAEDERVRDKESIELIRAGSWQNGLFADFYV